MEDSTCAILDLGSPLESHAMFGVFDGHGGAAVSRRAAEELPPEVLSAASALNAAETNVAECCLRSALPALDSKLRADGDGKPGFLMGAGGTPIPSDVLNEYGLTGSTAIVALVELESSADSERPTRIVVANVGDSRAVLCKKSGEAIALSEDQKPECAVEKERIEKAGGFVGQVGPCVRVDGWGLNLSRALGDFHYKARDDLPSEEQKVSAHPEIMTWDVTDEDEFLFLGCDGVFELHTNQSAIDVVRNALQAGKPLTEVVAELVDASCSPNLLQTNRQGGDNVSAMVILLGR